MGFMFLILSHELSHMTVCIVYAIRWSGSSTARRLLLGKVRLRFGAVNVY
jgi:multidrug transporter EmrE-like cation transporter